ncbi:tryptophan-tRNA ligase [Batrachochytrium salamandrivorans]|nr:tryptophan-tRNA ligase [Batrachochytrium salamandrivorans]
MFTKWLQDVFDCPLVIQLTDDEKYLFQKLDKPLDEFQRLGYENARDIMAVGFNPQKTFIFLNTEYMGHFYPLVCEIQKHVTYNQTRGIFGFTGSTSIGQIAFPAIQAAPSFSEAFPVVLGGSKRMTCLIPCAIDQDPYFRMTRDVAKKLGLKKPALVHAKFFPALQGINAKMSGSITTSAVMVSDSEQDIRKKIASAFSGGRSGDGQQELLGANLDEDVAFQWLRFFELDDLELARIERLYGPGQLGAGENRMMTKEIKTILANKIVGMAAKHQANKLALTQDTMNEVFKVRCIL